MLKKVTIISCALITLIISNAKSDEWICHDATNDPYLECSQWTIDQIYHRTSSGFNDFLVRVNGVWYRITYKNNSDGQPTKEQSTLMALLISAKQSNSHVNLYYDENANNEIIRVLVE